MSDDHLLDNDTPKDGIDVLEMIQTVREGWLLIVVSSILCIALAIGYLHIAVYKYTASLQVTPAQQNATDRGSSLPSGLGGLASLAGINVPSTGGTLQFNLYLESLKTREVADEVAKNQALMRIMFDSEWDEETQSFQRRGSGIASAILSAVFGMPPTVWTPPNGARVQSLLREKLIIDTDPKKNYLATISFDDRNPEYAIAVLGAVNEAADGLLRRKSLVRAQVYIAYLSRQLSTTTVAEVREAITQSLGEQEKYLMMASSAAPFAAQPFAGPVASMRPTSPQPFQIVGVAIGAGIMLGVALSLALKWLMPALFARIVRIRLWPRRRPLPG